MSPKHTRKQVSGEATACKTNGSPDFSNDPVILGDVSYPHNSTQIKFFPKLMDDLDSSFHGGSPEQKPLKQSGCSLHKPCLVLRRSHDLEHGSKGASQTTNEYGQATVKSSYLQQKMVDNKDPNGKSNRVVNLRSSYFVDKSDDAGSDGKSKKMIVRSSYFKHNKSSKSSRIDEADVQLVMDDSSGDGGRDNDHCEKFCVKRKVSPTVSNSEQQVETKHARRETNIEAEGNGPPTDGNKSVDVMVGEKFGCNIAHIGHYSDISGKTLDKFVSAVSSFKYNSSGSRASGLRAPLRDVKNICPRRKPAASINIGSFAYVTSNGMVARGTGRR